MRRPRILISAGEASGDRLAAGLVAALRERLPQAEFSGMGGERMREAGVRLVAHSRDVAVVGITEVARRLPAILRARRALGGLLSDGSFDLFLPVDFPDFHLPLARRAGRSGVPVVYYVSPQVWAWRRGRVRTIRRVVRRMLVLFPFEVPLYRQAGVPVTFVGHPAVDGAGTTPAAEGIRERAGLDARRPAVALAPGSRPSEIARLLPVLLAAARLLERDRPELEFLIPIAPGVDPALVHAIARDAGPRTLRVHAGDFPALLRVCRAGAVASGTASLEAALVGLPMVVVYRMGWLSYAIGRALVRLPDVALPNLVAGRRIVPELIQGACTPEGVAAQLGRYLDHPREAEGAREVREIVRQRLGGPGAFARAADAVVREIESLPPARAEGRVQAPC